MKTVYFLYLVYSTSVGIAFPGGGMTMFASATVVDHPYVAFTLGVAFLIAGLYGTVHTSNKVGDFIEETKRKKVVKPSTTKDNTAKGRASSYGLETK